MFVVLFSAEVLAPALLLVCWGIGAFAGYNISEDFREAWHHHFGGHYVTEWVECPEPSLREKLRLRARAIAFLRKADVVLNKKLW